MDLRAPSVYDPGPVTEVPESPPPKKDPLDEAQIARRLRVMMAMLAVVGLGLAAQLVRRQVVDQRQPQDKQAAARSSLALRGTIVDRDGYPLALDVFYWNVNASPREVPKGEEESIAEGLARLTGVPKEKILGELTQKEKPWTVLALDQDERVRKWIRERQQEGELTGIYLEPVLHRFNPEGASTAQLIGVVSPYDKRNAFYGVEGCYHGILSGKGGPVQSSRASPDVWLPPAAYRYIPSAAKHDLVLTIDRDIQSVVVEELQYGVKEFGAQGGTVIVMEPATGAILADFSLPTFEPSKFPEYAQSDSHIRLLRDRSVSEAFEPGSIFKPVTMAAGLDAGAIKPDDTYVDRGCEEFGEQTICNSGHRAAGRVNMYQVLPQSLNVGVAHISRELGPKRFYASLSKFGFGRVTEVDLQGEDPGSVRHPSDPMWSESDLATHAFGQGLTVTPIQMVTAIAAIANRGMLMKPHVVSKVVLGDRMIEIEPVMVQQAVSPETARIVTDMMVKAAKEGAAQAAVPGYTIAGKTGTAEIPGTGGYDTDDIIASFVGFAPADDPKFVILVKIDKPAGDEAWGMYVAAPIFRRIAQRLFVHLGIPPDEVRHSFQATHQEGSPGYQPDAGEG